jgi:hypothetical protein
MTELPEDGRMHRSVHPRGRRPASHSPRSSAPSLDYRRSRPGGHAWNFGEAMQRAEAVAAVAVLCTEQRQKVAHVFDRCICFDGWRNSAVSPPHRAHSRRARSADVYFGWSPTNTERRGSDCIISIACGTR